MQKNIIITSVAIFLSVLFICVLHFNDYNPITGAAVTESADYAESHGTYSIKPSFKVTVDYNMRDYELLKQVSKEILEYVAKCENTTILSQCVSDAKIKLNEKLAGNNLQFVDLSECGSTVPDDLQKRIYGFCVKSNKKVLAYNSLQGKTGSWPVVIKFALYFPEKATLP